MLPLPPLALVNGLVGLILGMNAPVRGKNQGAAPRPGHRRRGVQRPPVTDSNRGLRVAAQRAADMNGNQVTGVAARAEPERDVMCGLEVVLADGVRSLGAAMVTQA